jgi:site-specific DNA recombinase
MSKRAALYARVSTIGQAEAGLSIPDQLTAGTNFCNKREWPVLAEYVDAGASGTDENRPNFQRMIDDAVRGTVGFNVIVVHSQSRFFRDAFLAELYRRRLDKAGVEVVSTTQDFGEGPVAEMALKMVAIFDEFTSKETAKHVLRTMIANAQAGFVNGLAPFGYRAVELERRGKKIKKRLEIHPDEAETVLLIYRLALSGFSGERMGLKEIAKELQRRNLSKRSGKPFSFTEVHQILTSTTYIGQHVYNKRNARTGTKKPPEQWVHVSVPSIVDDTTFNAVRAVMRERDPLRVSARFTGHPTLLSNLSVCDNCGAPLRLMTGKSGRYRYYTCSKAVRIGKGKGGCSLPRTIREYLLDELVVNHLADTIFEPKRLRVLLAEAVEIERSARDEAPHELERLVHRKSGIESRIANMHRAIETGMINFDDADFRNRLNVYKGERAQLELQIISLRNAHAVIPSLTAAKVREFSAAARLALRTGETRMRRAYLRFFLTRVLVKDHQIEIRGHKRLLAKAYGEDWRAAALNARALKRGAVPAQVDKWCARVL